MTKLELLKQNSASEQMDVLTSNASAMVKGGNAYYVKTDLKKIGSFKVTTSVSTTDCNNVTTTKSISKTVILRIPTISITPVSSVHCTH
jgi:hypothetical protein